MKIRISLTKQTKPQLFLTMVIVIIHRQNTNLDRMSINSIYLLIQIKETVQTESLLFTRNKKYQRIYILASSMQIPLNLFKHKRIIKCLSQMWKMHFSGNKTDTFKAIITVCFPEEVFNKEICITIVIQSNTLESRGLQSSIKTMQS